MKEKTLLLKQMYFSKNDVTHIQKEAQEKGITFSELVRRILSQYIQEKKEK